MSSQGALFLKKVKTLLLIVCILLLAGSITQASLEGVSSNPYLFTLIKTDTSKNQNVEVGSESLYFTPGKGVGGKMFGFQPGSRYTYKGLFEIKNESKENISIWYTLEDDMADLYDQGIFYLDLEGMEDGRWRRYIDQNEGYDELILAGEGTSNPIGFTFSIPSKTEFLSHTLKGNIVIHAATTDKPPPNGNGGDDNGEDIPSTGESFPWIFYLAGFILLAVGLIGVLRKKRG